MSPFAEAFFSLLAILVMLILTFIAGTYIGFRTGYAARNAELKDGGK